MELLMISELVICLLLIAVVLIQNKNVTLNLSSMSWWMWETKKRWPEKILQNATIILGTLFILNSLALVLLK